jgi:hypothetical protein
MLGCKGVANYVTDVVGYKIGKILKEILPMPPIQDGN